MAHYQIDGFLKHAEKDDYENGCTGEYTSDYIKHQITGFTLAELIEKCQSFTQGELCEDLIEPNRLDFQVMEDGGWYPATEKEMEQWKRGEIDLYLCEYSAIVTKVEDVDLTVEFDCRI